MPTKYGYDFHPVGDRKLEPQSKKKLSLLRETCTVILWLDCFGKEDSEMYCGITQYEGRDLLGNAFFVHRTSQLLLSVYVDDIKTVVQKENLGPMWSILRWDINVEDATLFLSRLYWS